VTLVEAVGVPQAEDGDTALLFEPSFSGFIFISSIGRRATATSYKSHRDRAFPFLEPTLFMTRSSVVSDGSVELSVEGSSGCSVSGQARASQR